LLRRKAAEEVKRQQEIKERERQKTIAERTGGPKPLNDLDEGNPAACKHAKEVSNIHSPFLSTSDALTQLCKDYHNRIYKLNEHKWDLELSTCIKEYEINELSSRVNDMRGRL